MLALTAAACSSGGSPAARPAGGAARASGPGGGGSAAAGTITGPATVTTAAQARQVFDAYVTRTDRALAAGNATAALALAQDEPWKELSTAIATAKFHRTAVAPYRYGTPAFYIPAPHDYPRWFVASVRRTAPPGAPASVAGVPQAATGQALMLFQKEAEGLPWKLSGTVQLRPGQQVPKLATTSSGNAEVARLDDTRSYLARPDVVGPLQAAVVDDGPAAPAAAAVASGPLTTGMYQQQAALKPAAGESRQWTLQGSRDGRFALRTADGGALVFYAMNLYTTVKAPSKPDAAKAGRTIAVPPEFVPLLPPGAATMARASLRTQYTMAFAAIDPPASAANAKIQFIAVDGAPAWISDS